MSNIFLFGSLTGGAFANRPSIFTAPAGGNVVYGGDNGQQAFLQGFMAAMTMLFSMFGGGGRGAGSLFPGFVSPFQANNRPLDYALGLRPFQFQNMPGVGRFRSPQNSFFPNSDQNPGFQDFYRSNTPGDLGLPLPSQFLKNPSNGQRFGAARDGHSHKGLDFAAPIGTPVQSIADGTVIQVTQADGNGGGNRIAVRHADGTVSKYMHLSAFNVQKGQRVGKGQRLGAVGNTGVSSGPHLHLEIHKPGGGAVDPLPVLARASQQSNIG